MVEIRSSRWDNLLGEFEPSHLAYWKIIKALKADNLTPMPPLDRGPGAVPAFDAVEKANCLAYSIEAQCSPNPDLDAFNVCTVEYSLLYYSMAPPTAPLDPVSSDDVRAVIESLKQRKSPGPDGIRNEVLKRRPDQLITLLVCIFNAAIAQCHFPAAWKRAHVIGIHKPGKKSVSSDSYRPISLLSSIGKVYEKLLLSRLQDAIKDKKIRKRVLL